MATIQLSFFINLTDQATAAALQATYPRGVSRGPIPASVEFSAPFIGNSDAPTYPCTRVSWMPPGAYGVFPMDRAFFTINDGFFGHLFGRDQKYAWVGYFQYIAPVAQSPAPVVSPLAPTPPTPPAGTPEPEEEALWVPGPMRQIAFAEGFENLQVGSTDGAEGAMNDNSQHTREASRMPDGFGLAIRQSAVICKQAWNGFGATPTARGWERFYLRIRNRPVSDACIWRVRMGSSVALTNTGMVIQVNSSGALSLRDATAAGLAGSTSMGLSNALELNRWYCIDIHIDSGTTDTGPEPSSEVVYVSACLYIDHQLVINATGNSNSSVDPVVRLLDDSLVGVDVGSANNLEADIDDWIGFILPDGAGVGTNELWKNGTALTRINPGPDWTHGHHIAAVQPFAFDAAHSANWTGNFRGLAQIGSETTIEDILTSSTSGALLAVATRVSQQTERDGCIGCQAVLVTTLGRRATAGNPQLGFTMNRGGVGTLTQMTTVTAAATNQWWTVMYNPIGEMTPWTIETLVLRLTKAADANLTTIQAMYATVVMVGCWDTCDGWPGEEGDPVGQPPTVGQLGIHNAPYPFSPWCRTTVRPDSPVWVKGGTYTGNNLGQDILAKIPAHFFWVRNISVAVGSIRWWSSLNFALWGSSGTSRGGLPHALQDPDYVSDGADTSSEIRALLRISGSATASNATGSTFQYIAVGDPGQRFMLNGAVLKDPATASFTTSLTDADFLPEFAFFATQFGAVGGFIFIKAPCHTAALGGTRLNATEITNVATFGLGTLTTATALHPSAYLGAGYNLWRQRDGGDYATYGLTEPVPFQVVSWTGDGAASRTVSLPRASGKRPLWAIVVGTGTNSYVRDPSHLTNTSTLSDGGSSTVTTAITGGGVDQISVGSTLNTNGMAFSAFVIMAADAVAGNGGWGGNTEQLYDPIPAPGSQWDDGYTQDELDDLENPPTTGTGTGFDDGPTLEDDLADTLCVPYVLRAVNLALSRLGISDLVTSAADLLTPTTRENTMVATLYEHCLRATLRDFPWAHATRYANLVLVDGSETDPVNGDWIYSFRAPTAMLFPRRLVPSTTDGRKYTATPPPFRMSEDSGGPLLYTNEVRWTDDATPVPFVELEYTIRPDCGTKAAGDQLFVSTFAHRLAAEIGPPLGRDKELVLRSVNAYEVQRNIAAASNVREQQQDIHSNADAPWIEGR